MKEGWVVIFTSNELFQTKLAEDVLKQHGIESHIVNQPDSVIPTLGAAELYAPEEKAAQALEVLKANNIVE